MLCSSVVLASYAIGMVMPSDTVSLWVYSVYNIFEAMTVMSMLSFVCHYLGNTTVLKKSRIPIWVVAAVDAVLTFLNPFLNFFYFKIDTYVDKYGNCFNKIVDFSVVYFVHTTLISLMTLATLGFLLHRMLTAPKDYFIKYASIFFALVVVFVLSFFYINFSLKFNYALPFYFVEGICVFYYAMLYVPRGLMERLLFFTVASMKDGIISIDIDGKIVHSNKAAHDFCEADVEIVTLEEQVKIWMLKEIEVGSSVHIWETTRNVNGEKHYYTNEYRKIYDSSSKYIGCFFLIHDRTDEVRKVDAETYRATHDKLTRLYNREFFYEVTDKWLREKPSENYNIVVTDVKNFKIVNDVFGVDVGDKLLIKIAEQTRKFGGRFCVYGRLSGDRFALCIPRNLFSEDALMECYSSIGSFIKNTAFKTHIHIGVYEVKDRNIRVPVMCDRANLALLTIKDSFRSHIAYYAEELRETFIGSHRIISEFEIAIADGQFHPYIQPQISANGNIRGGEVLVRWMHPEEGMISPVKFIKILEQTGLISRLDKYMWELACKQLNAWTERGFKKSYISINISQKDFYLLDVYEVITSLVEKYNIAPKRLHLEVTETAIMDSPENNLKIIHRLREKGFIVEIDDFGSGYSSLNMLKDLDADVLKIDMGFLQETNHAEKSKTILRMIITLAKSLKMEVITEGVETKEHVEFLNDCGCDIYQGYYFAKPMPVKEFELSYLNKRFRLK